jgi:biotin carboxyl carrier protein
MNKLTVTIDNRSFEVEVSANRSVPGEYAIMVDGAPLTVYVPDHDHPELADWMLVDGRPYELVMPSDLSSVQIYNGRYAVAVRDQETRSVRQAAGDGRVKAPIPGLIARLNVDVGQSVESGQPLLVLEAMKMENEIRAPKNGVVRQVAVKPGQTVMLGELLLEVE